MPTTYADANDFKVYWGREIEDKNEAHVNLFLTMAATPIQAALQSVDALNCSKDAYALTYLKTLNVILAAVLYQDLCEPHLTVEEKRLYLEWANNELSMIRNGTNDLCSGATGKDFPSIDWAEQGVDEFSAAKIIAKDL